MSEHTKTPSIASSNTPSSPTPRPEEIGTVYQAEAVPPVTVENVEDLLEAAVPGYSPSHPEYIFDGHWEDFCGFEMFEEERCKDSFSVSNFIQPFDEDYADGPLRWDAPSTSEFQVPFYDLPAPHSPNLVPGPLDAQDGFFSSQAFTDWYLESMHQGALDAVTYKDPAYSGSSDSVPNFAVNPSLLKPPVETINKAHDADEGGSGELRITDAVREPIRVVLDYLQALLDAQDTAVAPPALTAEANLSITLNNSDLHDPAVMHANDTDDNVSDCTDDSSDYEGAYYLEPHDILRHYWYKGDIKYTISADSRRYYMTAEEMERCFGGVNFSLWTYWRAKRAGRILYRRIIDHLRRKGHSGFFREMLFHLCPRWLRTLLYAHRQAGTLDSFVIPDAASEGKK